MRKLQPTIVTKVTIGNGQLNETREKLVVNSDGTQKVLCHTEHHYPLHEVTRDELFNLRKSRKPGFVLVSKGRFYYATIDRHTKLFAKDLDFTHLCAECAHLAPSCSTCKECPKVIDASMSFYLNHSDEQLIEVLKSSKRIEKYDFIALGYETFNTDQQDSFVVAVCSDYE